jgi:hypothetical protein
MFVPATLSLGDWKEAILFKSQNILQVRAKMFFEINKIIL